MRPDQSDPAPIDWDLDLDPLDDDLPIDLMNDSFFIDGIARIMAEARARGAVATAEAEVVADEPTTRPVDPAPRG